MFIYNEKGTQILKKIFHFVLTLLKVSKSRKQFIVSSIFPKNEQNSLSFFFTQDSEFCSFFGRIEDTIIFFRDCLTFKTTQHIKVTDDGQ